MTSLIRVLEVGGTHVTAATVDTMRHEVRERSRHSLDSSAAAPAILDTLRAAAMTLADTVPARWAVAMPDPFDYELGIGRFHGVGKFESLAGVDVRSGLVCRLGNAPEELHFCNDADAFTVGEWLVGAARGTTRVTGLTLGTGVGSGWVDGGRIVDPGRPPGGRAHRLCIAGAPLEETMSRRAIRRAYACATGDHEADVREIAERARGGDEPSRTVLAHALRSLGSALAGPIRDFGAEVIVVGGSMSASWDLYEPWFREAADGVLPPVRIAARADAAPLLGAAYVAVTTSR